MDQLYILLFYKQMLKKDLLFGSGTKTKTEAKLIVSLSWNNWGVLLTQLSLCMVNKYFCGLKTFASYTKETKKI